MKKLIKITAVTLAAAALVMKFAAAAQVDTRAFAAALSQNKFTRLVTPVVYTLGDVIELCKNAPAEEKAEIIDRGHVAYVVSAYQHYNVETDLYYLKLTLINGTGKFTMQTVEDVRNYRYIPILKKGNLGRLKDWEGGFVRFDTNDEGLVKRLDEPVTQINTVFREQDGLYLVNIGDLKNGRVYFYETDRDITDAENTRMSSAKLHETGDGYDIITIDGDEYAGENIFMLSKGENSLTAGIGNAIIQINDGEVTRIFSFLSGYES